VVSAYSISLSSSLQQLLHVRINVEERLAVYIIFCS